MLDFSAILVFRMDEYIFNKRFGFSSLPDMGFPCTQKLKKLKPVWNFISANCHIGFSRVNIPGGNLTGRNHLEKKTGAFCRGNLPGIHPPRVLCVHYFLSNVYFSPSDSPSKTMKNIFISSKKLFFFSRYSNFCISLYPSFVSSQPLL